MGGRGGGVCGWLGGWLGGSRAGRRVWGLAAFWVAGGLADRLASGLVGRLVGFVAVLIDCSVARQTYVEDCQVCCCPIVLDVHVYGEGDMAIEVRRENGGAQRSIAGIPGGALN